MGINMVINPYWFIILIFLFYAIVFISKRILLPPFATFFSKPLNKISNDAIYMLLIYVLLIFIYTFTSTPILNFILNNNTMDHIGISISFGIIFTGLLRIIAAKHFYKEVAFVIFCQVFFNLLAFILLYSFFSYDYSYFLRIHDEFLFMIEEGYFKLYMIPLLIILFIFIEVFIKGDILLGNKIKR